MELSHPWALLSLVIVPVVVWLMKRRRGRGAVRFSAVGQLQGVGPSWRTRLRVVLPLVRVLCIALLAVALARPRQASERSIVSTKGTVMEIVVDRSSSMAQEMLYGRERMTRLDVVKSVLADFVKGQKGLSGRGSDMLGLITFAGYAETNCPFVQGPDALAGFLAQTETVKLRSEDGTAIGDAIALAAARLRTAAEDIERRNARLLAEAGAETAHEVKPEFEIKSKAIVLLTDGRNNRGEYSPLDAAALAEKWGIKIYTIGIGSAEEFTKLQTPFGEYLMPARPELDENLLKAIAERTGGMYGRAGDAKTLHEVFETIDKLEKTEVESVHYGEYDERFGVWALLALVMLGVEVLLGCTVLGKVP